MEYEDTQVLIFLFNYRMKCEGGSKLLSDDVPAIVRTTRLKPTSRGKKAANTS